MADIKTNQQKVYNALKGMGFSGIGANEQEFAAKMGNPKNREKVYNALTSKGYKGIGKDQAAFDSLIYQAPKPQPQVATQPQPIEQPAVQPTQQAQAQYVSVSQPQQPATPFQAPQGFGQLDISSNQLGKQSWEQPAQEEEKPNLAQDTMRALQGDEKASKKAQKNVKVANQRMKDEADYASKTGKMLKNPVESQLYAPTVGYDENGNPLIGYTTDEDRVNQYQKEQKVIQESDVVQAEKRLEKTNKRLDEIERNRFLNYTQEQEDKSLIQYLAGLFGSGTATSQAVFGDNYRQYQEMHKTGEERDLEASRHMLNEGLSLVREARKEATEGSGIVSAAKQIYRNLGNTAGKISTWDLGATDFNTQSRIVEALIRLDNGDTLTDSERELLGNYALNTSLASQYGDKLSGWARAAQVTGESLPFMLEMVVNPASGLGQGAQKAFVTYATKKVAANAMARGMEKVAAERYAKRWVKNHAKSVLAGKIATRVVGDVVGGQTMAATTGALRTIADAKRRYSEGMIDYVDSQGNVTLKDKDQRLGAMEAFTKAWAAQGIENSSEMWGEYLAPLTGYFSRMLGKATIGKAGREAVKLTGRIGDVNLNKVQRFIYDVTSQRGVGAISQGLDNFLKRTKWNGLLGEYAEEELGNLANAMVVGDMTFDNAENTGIFNLDQHIETFNGVALLGGFISALHTGAFSWDKYRGRMSKIDKRGAELFSDWQDIKDEINGVIDDNMALNSTITSFVNNKDLSQEKKKVVLDYTAKVLEGKGAEMAEFQPRMQSSSVEQKDGQFVVTSTDAFGNAISQQAFDTEEEAKAFQGELKMRQQSRDMKDYLQMTGGLSYAESADLVEEFLGLNSGTWVSDEAQAQALADIQNPKTTLGKQFQEFKRERIIQKARASREAIAAFEEQNGWEPGAIRELTEADPMQLSDEELQMQDQARDFLEQLAYPSNEVHVEHEQQVGAEAAQGVVEEVISEDDMIDPLDNEGQLIVDQYNNARNAANNLFARNEDLAQEFWRLLRMGLSPQEVISSLDTFSPADVQTIIDYFNAEARQEAFMREAARQIDDVAHRNRERRTFQGTINGLPDKENVVTIMDDEGNSYALVSGNISTDSQWNVTGSDSGLIIGVDANGDFVSLSDKHLSILPTTQTLDQYEESERIRLQEQVTSVIDPNQTMMQQEAAETTEQSGNVSGEAGAEGTGANEPLTTASPVAETQQPTQQPAQQPQQPSVTIDSVTDNDGIKRYENGISVDDAIADILTDGFDVDEVADASIAEAQQAIEKIDKKSAKTRKDLIDKKKAQDTITYYNNIKARYLELNPPYVDPQPFIQQMSQATSKKKADEILNAALQAGVKAEEIQPAHTQKVSDLIAKEEEERRKAEEITEKDLQDIAAKKGTADGRRWLLDRRRVPSYAKRIKMAKLIYGDLFDDEFSAWRDLRELISSWLGKGRMFDPDSFGQALGWDMGVGKDAAKVQSMFTARRENGGDGMTWDAFVHQVWESSGDRFDTEDISRELEEMFRSALDKYDLTEYQLQNRVAEAENALVNQENYEPEEGETLEQNADIPTGGLPFAPPVTQRPLGMSEEDAVATIEAMKEHATVAPVIEINDENWQNNVSTPVGSVKMGEHQKEKMFVKGREQQYGMLLETLTNPDIVLEEMDSEDSVFHERPSSYIFVKTFVKPDGTKYVHFESVTVSQDGMEVSISSHIIKESKLKDKLMNDKMLYKNESLSPNSSEWRLAEQQEAVPDLLPTQGDNVSEGKDTENSDTSQENQPKSLSREEYLTLHPLTEEQIMADTEATEDEKLNAIDFLKGEDNSAISQFYYNSIYNRAQQPKEEQKSTGPQWQYEFHYDKDSGRAWITRDDVSGRIPIGDGRFRIEGKNLAELRGILENPANNLGPIMEQVEAQLHNAEVGEQLRKETSDPMEAINQAATEFKAEQERKAQDQADIDAALKEFDDFLDNAKGSNIIDKFMRKGLEGNDKAQTNLFDMMTGTNEAQRAFLGDLLRVSSKVGYAYIKSGIHDFQAWSKQMADAVGRKLKDVLGWDNSLINDFINEVWEQKYTVNGERMRLREHAEKLKNGKAEGQAVNVNKTENNEAENDVSLQQEAAKPAKELEGDSAEFAERQKKITDFRMSVHEALRNAVFGGEHQLKTMQNVRALANELGLTDMSVTDLQELVETEIVSIARKIAENERWTDEQKFVYIRDLYNFQPTLSARDNDRINKQQYSTPAPMAFLMGKFVDPQKKAKSGLEPSAGNGMLTINLPKEIMHVNDIDEMRLSNLQKQGFGEVTSQDGTKSFGKNKYDVIVTNPPFGSVAPKEWGVYEITSLEQQMALNALDAMKDDGRAAIIIGGNTEYKRNGAVQGKDRQFLNYLYQAYNVVDVINMDGKALYTKQGTGYPVRMILINGRKPKYDPTVYAPVRDKARAEQVKTYDELFKRVNDDILSNANQPASVHNTESGESRRVDDSRHGEESTQTGVRNVRTEGSEGQPSERTTDGRSVSGSDNTTKRVDGKEQPSVGGGLFDVGSRTDANEPSRTTTEQAGEQRPESRGNDTQRPVTESSNTERVGQRGAADAQQSEQPQPKRGLGTEKIPYRKQSGNPFTLQSLMPAEQADVVKKALEELGDVDQFLVDELGYSSKEELHQALAAEQIDSVAMAIHQMNQGSAFIIGDQTGIGKGRQAAALIRYGVKKGGFPVFITVKKALFSDMYRDLCDIGSPKLRPFIWSADDAQHSGNVTDKDGNVIYEMPSAKEQKRVVDYINKYGKLPKEYDYVLTTYDSFKSGTMDYEDGKKSPRKFPKGKSAGAVHINGQAKRDALEQLAQNSYVIMDESHNAGGEGSNVSNYLQYITTKAKGLTFLSATFAKRPGNMPIYSLKTAISKAGVKVSELIDAVKRGGATFQEIMSKALTEAGQMIRRERDMTGVTIDWRGIEDEEVIQKQREQYDKIIGLFNDIINFQRTYIDPIIDQLNDEAAETQGEVDHTPGTRDMGINNTPFASRTYNMVQQVLLSLKAEEAAKRAIEHLKLGRKPVITVANTNEGAADSVAATDGESMEMPDLGVNLKKGLQGTLRIQKKDDSGNATQSMIPMERLPEEAQQRYAEIMEAIENSSSGLSLSPIDVIKNELKKAGYKVGELTGRQAEFIYNEDGTVKRVRRQDTDKKKIAADFNNGNLDALILNRSAGTGISLHASTKFKDQRQRIMIVAQAQGDVNDEVQIRGRIDRTGQVLRGMYEYVVSQIPSEQRLLMMLKAKLRSLDANTTSSQKSKFNEMQVQDIMNKYGDQIVVQYLAENPDTYAKLADPLKWGDSVYVTPPEALVESASRPQGDGATASKILGRMALLTVKEQEKMLDDIGALYQNEIDRLNEMGENDLEITEMPLKAKTLSKQVWEQGIDPDSNNPFADNTYVEKVNMDVLRKPMKASEVKASQERLLGGKTWDEYKQETLAKVDEWAEKKKAETTETITERAKKKAAAEQERYVKGAKKAQEKNEMTDEEIERNGQIQYENIYKEEIKKLDDALAANEAQKQVFVDALETFTTDGVYALPSNIYDLGSMTFEPGFGKLIDIKISDNMSPNASTISFATLDGRRKITIPINGKVKQQKGEKAQIFPTINSLTAQARSGWFGQNIANTLKVLEQNTDNWDKLTSTAARKDGYIITGNLLKALVSTREQGVGGKLISYTTDTGEVRQGILMPDNFEPGGLTSKTPISAKKDELKYNRDKVESADGDVSIRVTNDWNWNTHSYDTLELTVPKSAKKGAKYYNDETLLSLMDGQFEGSSKMKAEFKRSNLDAVMKRLDELGVTVAEEHKEDNSPKRMITTSNPLEAINQAAESWRQTSQKPATNSKLQEISDMVNSLANRDELKGKAPTYIINSRQDLEALDGQFNSRVYREIERLYADTDTGAAYIPRAGIVVIFGEHLEDAKEAEAAWWHEQTHGFWQKTPENVRRKFGEDCLMWLKKNRPDLYNHITKPGNYPVYDWLNEACAFFIGNVAIETYGTERFLTGNFVGNPEICNFANELLNHIKNGRTKQTNSGANQLRRVGEGEQASATQIRGSNQQGRERGDNILRSEEESELQEVVDPIKAIELSAKRWKRERNDAIAGEDTPEKHSAKAVYDERLNRVETVFSEAYQDAMVSLKTAQNAIAQDKDIPDSQNAYMAENLMHGKNKNEMDLYNKELRDPLIKTINKIMNLTGMNWGDVDRYVYTKSGLERNREFFVRDWLEDAIAKAETEDEKDNIRNIEDSWNGLKDRTYQDLKAGLITYAEYLDELAQFIRREIDGGYKPEEHDYSGFRDMYGDEDGKYDEAEIIDELMNTEDMINSADDPFFDSTVNTLWEQINAATQYGLERYREAGMRSDEQIDGIEQMFHFYVPMRGFKDNRGEDMYQYFTGKGNAKSYVGGLLKHAKGRGSEANFPISTIFAMTYKAISDCNQNLVNQKIYRLCQANPNDLIVLSDSWAKLNEYTGEWEEVGPDIPEDATEEEVRQATLAWEEEMRQLALENKAKKIKGRAHFDYKPLDKKKQSEHIVDVRINGQPKKMIVTGNPRMAQALNGQLRFETKYFGKWYAAIKNMMASLFTSYSPTFALRNMFRDWTHFRTMLGVREGHGYASQANKYYRQSLFKMVGLFKKYREGTLDESNEMERDFKDFMDNGGITGFVFMQKVDDIQKQMEKLYKDQKAGKVIRLNDNLWMKMLHAVEAVNEGIENNARFATYRASRHYAGRTKARSAYDAKEITVNFNRKGAGGKTAGFKSQNKKVEDAAKAFGVTSQILGEGRIFFNATVQAIATTFKNFQNTDGSLNKPYIAKWTAKYAIPPFMFGFLLPAINKALAYALGGDDDDPYANLPEWTRRRNLCFYIGNDSFITIPVGQELAAFLALGDIYAGNTYAHNLKPVDRGIGDEIVDVMNTFSPVDVSTKITKGGLMEDPISEVTGRTFSVLAPLVAIEQNLGWTGRPIYREDKFQNDQYTPEYQMVYQSTNPVLTNAMKQLHEWGGGDDITRGKLEVNPAIIQYLWEQYTGGPGKVFSNTISIGKDAKDILTGNESDFNIRKVEGLKAFISQGDDRTQFYRTQAKYRKYSEDAKKLYHDVKGYENAATTDPTALMKLEKISQSDDFVRMQIVREADKQLSQINKAANKAEGKEKKELRKLYNQQVKEVVNMLDEVGRE